MIQQRKPKMASKWRMFYVGTTLVFVLSFYTFYKNRPKVSNGRVETIYRGPTNTDSEFLFIINKLKQSNKPALVTVINDAYMPFVHSWLCNTMFMNIHEQVFVIATDRKSRDDIAATWPSIKVFGLSLKGFHGNQKYSHAGYVRIMVKRTELILQILQHGLEVLLFDLDTFWKTDPIPLILRSAQNHDIAVVPVSNQHHVVCGGFIFMKPTVNMVRLWKKATEMMLSVDENIKTVENDKKVSEGENDQMFVSSLLNRRFADIKVAMLSLTDFPDGLWYGWNASVRSRPYLVVHNNWIIGNNEKMKRAKKFNQWFWDSDRKRCDINLVKQETSKSS